MTGVNRTQYRLVSLLFLPFLPLIYLTGYLAELGGRALFDDEKPEFTLRNVILLVTFIALTPLILVMTPIQKAYIRHLQSREH